MLSNNLIETEAKTQIEEVTYSSRSSLLHSHHHTSEELHIKHCLYSVACVAAGSPTRLNHLCSQVHCKTCRLDTSTLVNIRANFQSCAKQPSSSQGSSFTDVYLQPAIQTDHEKKWCIEKENIISFSP